MEDTVRLLKIIDHLNLDPLFLEFTEWLEYRNQKVINKLRSEHDNMTYILQLNGADIELSDIIKTIKTARDRLMEIGNQNQTKSGR